MTKIYVTDGSFEGMLTSIHKMYYSGDDVVDILYTLPMQPDFTCTYETVITDEKKATSVYDAIVSKISTRAAYTVTMAWLSELPRSGQMIINYLKLGFKTGSKIDNMLSHKYVTPINKAAMKIVKEKHLILGLCRFSEVNGNCFLAKISPDHNILVLIAPHFADRMSDQRWIIADTRRNISAIYDCEKWYIIPSKLSENIPYSDDELKCRQLWKKYFDTIAIAGKRNPKLQRNMMPKRYWKNLTEFI